MATGNLLNGEPDPAGPHGEANCREEFVVTERRRPGRFEEVAGSDLPMPARPVDLHRGVERQRYGRQLRCRIGVGDRTANRASVADLEVPDVRQRPGDEWCTAGNGGVVLGDRLPHQRTDSQ